MKKVLIAVLVFVGIIVLIAGAFGVYITWGLNDGKNMVINGVSLDKVKDGTYIGTYHGGRFSNELEITVKDHRIANVKILKDITFPLASVPDKVFGQVIEKQRIEAVDAVSGATVASKAYLKAIETAFQSNK